MKLDVWSLTIKALATFTFKKSCALMVLRFVIVDSWSCSDGAGQKVQLKSVAVFSGESLRLDCNVCEYSRSYGDYPYHNNVTIRWYWTAIDGEEVEIGTFGHDSDLLQSKKRAGKHSSASFILKIDEAFIITNESAHKAVFLSTQRGNLLIDNIQMENRGHYRCRFDALANGIGISSSDVMLFEVHVSLVTNEKFDYRMVATQNSKNACLRSSSASTNRKIQEAEGATFELKHEQISVNSTWSEWSACTVPLCQPHACGYRKRIGQCYVSSYSLKEANSGKPCRSEFLSQEMRDAAKDFADTIEYEECEISDCSRLAGKKNVKHFLESLLKSKNATLRNKDDRGITQLVGRLLGKVDFFVFFQRARQTFALTCGDIRNRSKNILWIENKRLLYPFSDRLKIDILNRLYFSHLEESDSGTYSCWDEAKLVGIYTVFVSDIYKHERVVRKWLILLGIPVALAMLKSLAFFQWRLHWARQRYSIGI